MSAFLGPVHHWMYDKIQRLEENTEQILELNRQENWVHDLDGQLKRGFGSMPQGPLETVIDASNIHGWLAGQVDRAEGRFAAAVQHLLSEQRAVRLDALVALQYRLGRVCGLAADADVQTAYQALDAVLLDGMPCDGGRRVVAQSSGELVWEYEAILHPLCQDAAGQAAFATLREAFLEGLLEGSGLRLEQLAETAYRLVKGA